MVARFRPFRNIKIGIKSLSTSIEERKSIEDRVPGAGVPSVTSARNHAHSCQREASRPRFYDGRTLLR